MNNKFSIFRKRIKPPFLFFLLLLVAPVLIQAQAPTSLRYPASSVFVANVSNAYLSPTVAGNVSSYSITPALPAGLSFNTSTGLITGTPTAASAATTYTVTATGGSPAGSTSYNLSIQVTNNYFNNAYSDVNFGGTGVTITNKIGNGRTAGDIVLYQNVATLSGQSIDAIVRTTSLTGGSFIAFDTAATSGANFSNNQARFFSPQLNLTGAGSAQFDFQFILGGSYNNTTNTGTNVVLQNVKLNTYDIDGNTQANSNQYNDLGGFDTSEVGSFSTIGTSYNATTGLTRFLSNTTANYTNVLSDTTRARISYRNMSTFTIRVGAGSAGNCFFFLDFGAGPAFSTAVPTAAPSIDLNTSVIGVNNANNGCGSSLAFTGTSQTNIAAPAPLNAFDLSFPTSAITNGASEQLLINGATSGGTIALNFADAAAITNVAIGGVTYAVTASVASGTSTLSFTNSAGGTFTVAQAETLLDALQYNNASATPTSGDRSFTVDVRNTSFKSPNAIFTATLNCVTVSGKIYHDINGQANNLVDSSGTAFAANFMYVVRVNPTNNQVIDSRGIAANGTYTFGTVSAGTYAFYVSSTAPAVGSTFTAATYPNGGYVSTGENLGSAAGNDLLTDGKLILTIGSTGTANANFGVEVPPVTTTTSLANQPNPGGFNNYTIPAGSFSASDADGNVTGITITSFPTGANYLKIGTTFYTNPSGGVCPPLTTCTTWPGTVTVPYSGGVPTQSISVDPAADVAGSVVISFTATDDANLVSNQSTLTIPFVVTNYNTLSGNVWNDYNGDGVKDAAEALTAVAGSGQTLYAIVIQNTNTYSGVPTVFSSTPVSASSGYTLSGIPSGNNYSVWIASLAAAPATGSAASAVTPALAPGYIGVSTVNGSTIANHLTTYNPTIALTNLAAAQTGLNFGIQQMPTADTKTYTGVNSQGGGPTSSVSIVNTNNSAVRYIRSLNMSGTASTGPIPGFLSGNDPDGGASGAPLPIAAGTPGVSLVINPASYTNAGSASASPTMVTYNGVQLQPGGCKGTDVGNSLCSNFNSTTGYWEIPGYNGTLLKVLGTLGTTQMGFSYAWKDASGATGGFSNYSVGFTTALPLKLTSFEAKNSSSNIVSLQWTTENERNTDRFVVERSADGAVFTQLGTVKAAGAAASRSYNFTDVNAAAGNNFYRLGMYDQDGSITYSATQLVKINSVPSKISVLPNPVRSQDVTISWNAASAGKATIIIYESTGKQVYSGKLDATGKATIPVHNWSSGTYFITIDNGRQKEFSKLLVN
ncbi:MAG: T9SS type A sorting domain-containing protein [Williamsia sp.]|nr:T9SS type A sorting domain-containing protein [Williamsia sp.]